ncbi:MAG: nuclear transport factor 2 family protein [Gemmatimonadetes bacterium]|nr:nuclear transport factor 2 family protein [Gemmatimonadota bacterium]MBL0178205.1 nuclear transport factor 2 family protein [Gemmatimonadota bacterium]
MRLTPGLLLFAAVITAPVALAAQQTASAPSDQAAVRAVVERYLHGLKFNDVPSLQAAFWPEAKLLFIKRDGTIGQLTQAEWQKGFVANAGKEEEGTLRITAVDITDNAASVKVTETYPKSVYVDYLNLLRVRGEWRIVNKIFTSRPR